MSVTIIYGVLAFAALLIFALYSIIEKNREIWLLFLFLSVFIVNIGYFALSLSETLKEALLANRISYLGSVFLPMTMQMLMLKLLKYKYKSYLPLILLGFGIAIFIIAASPGYWDIYYKEVSLIKVNGASKLNKVYGDLHILYYVYLFLYSVSTTVTIIYTAAKKKLEKTVFSIILAVAVFLNIGVWFAEQFVKIDFELLSVSYIISEVFLLLFSILLKAYDEKSENAPLAEVLSAETDINEKTETLNEDLTAFMEGINELTHTERLIFDSYVSGKSTKEIMAELNIKENTLKFHNKNIYGKLSVSSRKELVEKSKLIKG